MANVNIEKLNDDARETVNRLLAELQEKGFSADFEFSDDEICTVTIDGEKHKFYFKGMDTDGFYRHVMHFAEWVHTKKIAELKGGTPTVTVILNGDEEELDDFYDWTFRDRDEVDPEEDAWFKERYGDVMEKLTEKIKSGEDYSEEMDELIVRLISDNDGEDE